MSLFNRNGNDAIDELISNSISLDLRIYHIRGAPEVIFMLFSLQYL